VWVSQKDENKLHEVRSRCITLELTNQKLWDINKELEKDRVAMVKEIAQVSKERFAVGDDMAVVQLKLDHTLKSLTDSRREVRVRLSPHHPPTRAPRSVVVYRIRQSGTSQGLFDDTGTGRALADTTASFLRALPAAESISSH
jgi:hypothetical protein